MLRFTALALTLAITCSDARAAVITAVRTIGGTTNVSGGVNSGGLGTADFSWANGNDALNLSLTIDDTADTGTTWSSILSFSGERRDGGNFVRVQGLGNPFFHTSSLDTLDKLTWNVSAPTFVGGGTGNAADYVATFDGFRSFGMNGFKQSRDEFVIGGTTFNGNPGNSVPHNFDFQTLTGNLGANGLTMDAINAPAAGDSAFNIPTITSQFTVSAATAVPEPSSLAMLGLGAVGMFVRRRRKKAASTQAPSI